MNHEALNSILLIEDDPGDALLIREMLEGLGSKAQLATAERLADGIASLQSRQYDLVLLDMDLPDSAGLPTLTRLQEAVPDTPVIVLTGLDDEAFGIEAVKAGAQDYLVKGSFDSRFLGRSMFYAVERKSLEVELKRARDWFERQARIDYLTGAYNRLMFSELLKAEMQRARRYQFDLSLIMLDLDRFKAINDTFGHNTGDQVLKTVAQLIPTHLRAHDILARWGGEEFLILTPQSTGEDTAALAEKLRSMCELSDFGDGVRVTASFGVTQLLSSDTTESFIKRADEAMYRAKAHGRNRVETL